MEEAYLSDGDCISSWCKSQLDRHTRILVSCLHSIGKGTFVLPAMLGIEGLVDVAEVLVESSSTQ